LDSGLYKTIQETLKLPVWLDNGQIESVIRYLLHDIRGTKQGGSSNFDHVKDYRYVYPSFKQLYGVDLNQENISWWEYKMMLEGCFFNDCILRSVADIRNRKIPPKADAKTKRELSSLKHKYMLRTGDNGLGGMFRSLKGVSKDGS